MLRCLICSLFLLLIRRVDEGIMEILRNRMEECRLYEAPDEDRKCQPLVDQYEEAAANYFTKC